MTAAAPAAVAPGVDLFAVRTMVVRQVRWEADGVLALQLASADGTLGPEWTPLCARRPGASVRPRAAVLTVRGSGRP